MSTLVQHTNSPHYPQSASMNPGDVSARQQRPTNNPSKSLLPHELQSLYDILGQSRVTLATAVAQVLHGNNGTWRKQACGVFCFVKDYENRAYCFRLYDLRSRQSIYEETVPASLRLDKGLDVFYTFDGLNCKIGINFVDRDEAQAFCHHFHSKQEDRQKKKKGNATIKTPPVSSQQQQQRAQPNIPSAMSSMMNGIKPPPSMVMNASPPAAAAPVNTPKSATTSKSAGFFTIGRSKKKAARPDISAPIQSTLVHVGHIGTKESFFNDDAQKQLFEQVLTNLHISPEDQLYVRELVKTDGGLEKLLAKPTPPARDPNQQGQQQMSGGPPVIPPRSHMTMGRSNGGRPLHQEGSAPPPVAHPTNHHRPPPFQEVFNPTSAANQSTAPNIPPRPGPRIPDNAYPPMQAPPPPPPPPPAPPVPSPQPHIGSSRGQAAPPPPPPPPLPADFWNPSRGTGGPPAPPPAPPAPAPSSGSSTNTSAAPVMNLGRDNLLDDIRKGTVVLKPSSKRPALPEVSPTSGDSSPGAQDTMAQNILKILAERREKLIGPDPIDESDTSEGEWSN